MISQPNSTTLKDEMSLDILQTPRTTSEYNVSTVFQETVDKWIEENPVKYRQAQIFGEFIVSHPQFSNLTTMNVIQRDIIGDELLYKDTINRLKYYGIELFDDLTEYEIDVLKIKLGPSYVDKIKDILNNMSET